MTVPERGMLVPSFTLPDGAGRSVALWDFKHVHPLVLVLAADDDITILEAAATRHGQYTAAGAVVLAIVRHRPGRELPFPVLVDTDGRTIGRLTHNLPAVLVLDSYGALHERTEGPSALQRLDAVGDAIAEIELQCPECGVAEWR